MLSLATRSLAIAVATIISMAGGTNAQEAQTTFNVLVANERATSAYPVYVAEMLGFYADEGLKVNFLPTDTTVPYVAFLSNEDAEMVMLDPAQVLQAVESDLPISLVYEYMQRAPEALVVPESSDIRTIADLKGKTIGMASDRDQVTVNVALDTVGMNPEDVETVVIGDSAALLVNQLRNGTIQAYAGGSNETAALEANNIPLRHLTPLEISQQPGNSMVVWGPRKEEIREAIAGFLRAYSKAATAALLDIEAVAAMSKQFVPEQWENPDQGQAILDQSVYQLLLQRTVRRGEPQPEVWEELQQIYLDLGEITEAHDPASFLDDSFIEAANDYRTSDVREALRKWREANENLFTR